MKKPEATALVFGQKQGGVRLKRVDLGLDPEFCPHTRRFFAHLNLMCEEVLDEGRCLEQIDVFNDPGTSLSVR